MAASTHDQDVFSFYPDERICNGFEEVLSRYREIVPNIRLAGGPRSFAPIVEMATTIVERRGGQYHVLVIISNGQLSHSVTCSARLNYVPMSVVELIL
jgi:E3 ubiquitin-protein ligase RGLG